MKKRILWNMMGLVAIAYPAICFSGVVTGGGVASGASVDGNDTATAVAATTSASSATNVVSVTASTNSATNVKTITKVMKAPPSPVRTELLPPLPGFDSHVRIETDSQSFRQAVPETGFSLTPKQIEQFHQIQLESAMATNKGPLVHGLSIVLPVSLAPGELPPTIRLAFGYMTAITFVDSSGAPWPITSDALGNPAQFAPIVPKGGKSNILLMRPNVPGASTNIAVMLKGLDTPVVFPVTSTLQHADYRVTVRIDRMGPDATPPIFMPSQNEHTASKGLMTALEGIAPSKSSTLTVSGLGHVQAWRSGNTMYVRSRATLVSPSWDGQASGDGYTAYQMPYTPVLLFSSDGQLVNARISDGASPSHG